MKNILHMLEGDSVGAEILVTKFDEDHAMKFRKAVLEQAKLDPQRPITVTIDSYGGYVDSLASMIETLDEVPNPIITVCVGKAMSCGAILLSHGDVRFLGKHSRVMVHEVSGFVGGNVQDMKQDVKETVRLNEYFMGLLAKNCGFKSYKEFAAVLKAKDGRDCYLVGKEAIKFGIVDCIGLPRVSAQLLYGISKQEQKPPPQGRNTQTLEAAVEADKPKKTLKKSKSDSKKKK